MKLTGTRAALAAAIEARNGAAKEAAAAEAEATAFGGDLQSGHRRGGPYGDARHRKYAAEDTVAEERQRLNDIQREYADAAGVNKHYMRQFGKMPSEVISDAEAKARKAAEDFDAMAPKMDRLEAVEGLTRDRLERAKKTVNELVWAVLADIVPAYAAEVAELEANARKAMAALSFVTRGVNLAHSDVQVGHPLYPARSLLSGYIVPYEGTHKRRSYDEGVAPWLAAFNQLQVDASAPLPTDPAPKPVKAAA